MLNIGIDIDDTITDTFDYLMYYVADYFNFNINYLIKNNISYSNLPKECKEYEKDFSIKTYERILNDVPVKSDAIEIIQKLKENGFNIYIITARDNTIFKHPYEATEEQLKLHGIYYDKLICTFDKKQACIDNEIDLLIDDSIRTLDAVSEIGVNTLLFESKINNSVKSKHDRVSNWKSLFDYILNKYKDN